MRFICSAATISKADSTPSVASVCQNILERDNCREDVHCLLMRCYAHQNQVPLALRQFQIRVQALRQELDVDPATSTVSLYEELRHR